MTQSKTNQLLVELMADPGQSREALMYMDEAEKKNLIRGLMNTRMPGAISRELLQLQDDYLQEQLAAKGIVTLSDIPTIGEECSHIMHRRRIQYGKGYEEPTGTATLTQSYNLPCDYIIHTVGPIVYDRLNDTLCQDLRNCYENVLACCLENGIKSVAFCCISTGEFHFPSDRAAEIAWETVSAFLEAHENAMERIIFNVFKDSDRKIYEKILGLI